MANRKNRPMMKSIPGDCNRIAQDRASSKSGAPTKEYTNNYADINWNSKRK